MNRDQRYVRHPELPGWLGDLYGDANQLDFYWHLTTMLESETWSEVRAQPSWADLMVREEALDHV
jgi:hypothetical protein